MLLIQYLSPISTTIFFCSGDCGIKQVARHNHRSAGSYRHNHGVELAALTFVHGNGVRKRQLIEYFGSVDGYPSVLELDGHLAAGGSDFGNRTYIAVENSRTLAVSIAGRDLPFEIVIVYDMHYLVAGAVNVITLGYAGFLVAVERGLKAFVDVYRARRTVFHRTKNLHAVGFHAYISCRATDHIHCFVGDNLGFRRRKDRKNRGLLR